MDSPELKGPWGRQVLKAAKVHRATAALRDLLVLMETKEVLDFLDHPVNLVFPAKREATDNKDQQVN